MKLFVVSFLGLVAISTVQTRQIPSQAPEDAETLESRPQNYEYKQVILYLTPTEVRALERNNVLQKTNNEYYSSYVNNQLPAQKQEEVRKTIQQSKAVKPIHEEQEETTEKNDKLIDIPLFYPFQLIPLNNNNKEKELEKGNEQRWIEEIKKQIEAERENAKIENEWNPIPLKQNTQEIISLLQRENKAKPTDYSQLLQNAANNYDNKEIQSQLQRDNKAKLIDYSQFLQNAANNYDNKEIQTQLQRDNKAKPIDYSQFLQNAANNYDNKEIQTQLQRDNKAKPIDYSQFLQNAANNYDNKEIQTQLQRDNKAKPIDYSQFLQNAANNYDNKEIQTQLQRDNKAKPIDYSQLLQNAANIYNSKKNQLQRENEAKPAPDYAQLVQAANDFDNKNVLKVQDFYRLQYELEQINKNNRAEGLPRRPSKAQQPLYQQIKGIPAYTRAIRPLQEENPDALVGIEKHHHLHEKTIIDARRPLSLREFYRE